jgi:integrase
MIGGKVLYWSAGSGRSDTAAYKAACLAADAKRLELAGQESDATRAAYADAIAVWQGVAEHAKANPEDSDYGAWQQIAAGSIDHLKARLALPNVPPIHSVLTLDGFLHASPKVTGDVEYAKWSERLRKQAPAVVIADDQVGTWVQRFLSGKEAECKAGQISASWMRNLRWGVREFETWIKADTSVKSIDNAKVTDYRNRILATDAKPNTKARLLNVMKQFIGHLHDMEVIDKPRIMDKLRIATPQKENETYTDTEVRMLLIGAEGRVRLYVLLGLNCGFYQSDISDLLRFQVDLKAGTITRQRSKQKADENPPKVTWKLWPATVTLLRQELATEGDRALVRDDGGDLLQVGDVNGRTDAVDNAFRNLLRQVGMAERYKPEGKKKTVERRRGSFSWLRDKSASLLRDSQYHDVVDLFLGHAAAKVSDIHYAQTPIGRLSKGLSWLAKQYGI